MNSVTDALILAKFTSEKIETHICSFKSIDACEVVFIMESTGFHFVN